MVCPLVSALQEVSVQLIYKNECFWQLSIPVKCFAMTLCWSSLAITVIQPAGLLIWSKLYKCTHISTVCHNSDLFFLLQAQAWNWLLSSTLGRNVSNMWNSCRAHCI
jgi:hypothetical protein